MGEAVVGGTDKNRPLFPHPPVLLLPCEDDDPGGVLESLLCRCILVFVGIRIFSRETLCSNCLFQKCETLVFMHFLSIIFC